VLTLVWATATHLPKPERIGIEVGQYDWLAHAVGYLTMASCWLVWWLSWPGAARLRSGASVLSMMLVFAAADELTQPCVGRAAQWSDWLADATGTGLAILIVLSLEGWLARRAGASRE
jgi:VanZ family protein